MKRKTSSHPLFGGKQTQKGNKGQGKSAGKPNVPIQNGKGSKKK